MPAKYIDIESLKFILFQVHSLDDILNLPHYSEHDSESMDLFLDSVADFSDQEMAPYFKEMDEHPAYFKDGKIVVHPQIGAYMEKAGAMGLISGIFDFEEGGIQLPMMLYTATTYIQDCANNHLTGYGGLTMGAAELIIHFGDDHLKNTYIKKMLSGEWAGTMCLTEPESGSSLADLITKAKPTDQNYYLIEGQKIFISGGDHEYVSNFVHLVLARIEGAPAGTKGISLFVVPKNRINDAGDLVKNDVITAGDFQKMGQRGYCTSHLIFGENNNCRGWLVGEPHQGLKYMFMMMNGARIAVGRGAAAIVMAGYQASLEYAKERVQGRKIGEKGKKSANTEQTTIIHHADVRRMLLLQKVVAEGSLSLCILASKYKDLSLHAENSEAREKYALLLEILTPIVKTYPAESGNIAVSNGLQVLGGYGFTAEYILQQYYRDIRIFSIYEGTTGIQSLDLLGRKISLQGGKAVKLLLDEISQTCGEADKFPELEKYSVQLKHNIEFLQGVLQVLLELTQKGAYELFTADANYFLELMSVIIVGWLWLDMATKAHQEIKMIDGRHSTAFYESKIHAMKFYFNYELPKTLSLVKILKETSGLTIDSGNDIFL